MKYTESTMWTCFGIIAFSIVVRVLYLSRQDTARLEDIRLTACIESGYLPAGCRLWAETDDNYMLRHDIKRLLNNE